MVDLDSDPTKLIEVVEIGKQLLITRGRADHFFDRQRCRKILRDHPRRHVRGAVSGARQAEHHGAAFAAFGDSVGGHLQRARDRRTDSAGVAGREVPGGERVGDAPRNLLIYGLGGIIVPFIGIKLIDLQLVCWPWGCPDASPNGCLLIIMLLVFTVITGILYPLAVTGVAQLVFRDKANGSLIERDGTVVGSAQIGQQFTEAKYFHPRPSSAGDGYDSSAQFRFKSGTDERQIALRPFRTTRRPPTSTSHSRESSNALRRTARRTASPPDTLVPVDAVTGSAPGSTPPFPWPMRSCRRPRVAQARNLSIEQVQELIDDHTDGRGLGFLGERAVNVLELNVALDRL